MIVHIQLQYFYNQNIKELTLCIKVHIHLTIALLLQPKYQRISFIIKVHITCKQAYLAV